MFGALRKLVTAADELRASCERLADRVVGMGERITALEGRMADSEKRVLGQIERLDTDVRAFICRWSWPNPAPHDGVPDPLPPRPEEEGDATPPERRRR